MSSIKSPTRRRTTLIAIAAALAAACCCAQAFAADPQAEIIGGTGVTNISSWPFIVAVSASTNITSLQNGQFCGGSLVAPQWVVTAGHCDDPSSGAAPNYVQIGATDLGDGSAQVIAVDAAYRHPGFAETSSSLTDDIALLHLSQAPANAGSIAIPRAAADDDPPDGASVAIAGWGSVNSAGTSYPIGLRETTVNVVSNSTCVSDYGSASVFSYNICAAASGRDACFGDSGGPMTYGGKLVGLVSWGSGCAGSLPGVYTRVSSFQSWIDGHIAGTDTSGSDGTTGGGSSSGGGSNNTTGTVTKLPTVTLRAKQSGRGLLRARALRVVFAVTYSPPSGTTPLVACDGALRVKARFSGGASYAGWAASHVRSGKCAARVALRLPRGSRGRKVVVSSWLPGNSAIASSTRSTTITLR